MPKKIRLSARVPAGAEVIVLSAFDGVGAAPWLVWDLISVHHPLHRGAAVPTATATPGTADTSSTSRRNSWMSFDGACLHAALASWWRTSR